MLNLLTQYLGEGAKEVASIELNWIGQIIRWLIESVGIVAVGIIVFTLILKTIVLPLDIYSRIKTKKQALIMEEMRPQMEKLQKQYANDKQMYNQKVAELQKKSGASMFGACLPMIVSLVIFMFVFSAFSTYSQYANLENYNGMVRAYNSAVAQYVVTDDNPDGFLTETFFDESGKIVTVKEDGKTYTLKYEVDFDKFVAAYNKDNGKSLEKSAVFSELLNSYKEKYPDRANVSEGYENTSDGMCALVGFYTETPAAAAAEKYYDENRQDFLGIPFIGRNIWYPDSMLNKEIPDFSTFKSTVSSAGIDDSYREYYEKVTANLGEEKGAYNGYFVLIILSIGGMLVQQLISMKANKSTNELGSVDGAGAKTSKYMMIMMPLIFGVISFFYSSAFSLYMIVNTLYGILSTLLINKLTDISFQKKKEKEILNGGKKNKRK